MSFWCKMKGFKPDFLDCRQQYGSRCNAGVSVSERVRSQTVLVADDDDELGYVRWTTRKETEENSISKRRVSHAVSLAPPSPN